MKQRKHKGIYLKLNIVNDGDVIERLEAQPNKQHYIKDLIRTDMLLDSLRHTFKEGD